MYDGGRQSWSACYATCRLILIPALQQSSGSAWPDSTSQQEFRGSANASAAERAQHPDSSRAQQQQQQ